MSKEVEVKVEVNTELEEKQHQKWMQCETLLEETIEQLNDANIDELFQTMVDQVNVIWTQNLLIRFILCYKSQFGLSSNLICGLAKRLGYFLEDFNLNLTKQIIFTFIECFQNNHLIETLEILPLIADLYNYDICSELLILQVLQVLTKKNIKENMQNDDGNNNNNNKLSIMGIIRVIGLCGKKLNEKNQRIHDTIFEKLVQSSSIINQDTKISKEFKYLLKLKNDGYIDVCDPLLPKYNLGMLPCLPEPINFIISKELREPDDTFGEFVYNDNLEEVDQQWGVIKNIINDPKFSQIEEVVEEEVQDSHTDLASNENAQTDHNEKKVVDMTNSVDIQFKKEIYLILKSSLSGDEAAHKILKRRTPDDLKFNIVDIIIKTSIQEATYSKFYGIIAERLLNSHKAWKPAFYRIFKENFQQLDTFQPEQLRIIGKFWGHLFATDYIGFELFEIVKINSIESTAPSRIFIKFVFQELVADLAIDELKERLNEDYIQPFITGMFPNDDMDNIRYSINYFTAIGLGILTDKMRTRLEELENEEMERQHQQQENEEEGYKEVHEEEKEDRRSRFNRFSSRARNQRRSVTPPRHRRNNLRERSVTPPRERQWQRSLSPSPRRRRYTEIPATNKRNSRFQRKYRDNSLNNGYRNSPQGRQRGPINRQSRYNN
ncbi:U2-type spliceosomal complex subunit CWC22 PWA37_003903 [Arxiozyma heterogenica]|uniref:Pre-mRNA-splicing factor CWC22 n=1 Tax=Arxiozyma heterogenica TaxID=278026 RepID=A0AAN8A6P0_9SACH|nr:hypothetical protein RI543_002941 [Kazachstania heterogenica]